MKPVLANDPPPGVRAWHETPAVREGGYRDASQPAAVVFERAWRAIWGVFRGVFIALWGVGAAGFGLLFLSARDPAGLLLATLGGSVLYVGVAILVNRTRVRITPTAIELTEGPLPWPGGFSLPNDAPCVFVVRAPYNDLRNGGARWPAPQVSQVHLTCGSRTEVVFPQCPNLDDASALVRALRAAIEAATK